MPNTTPTTSEKRLGHSTGEIVLDEALGLRMVPAKPGSDMSYFVTLNHVHLGSATRIRTSQGPDEWRFHYYTRRDIEVSAKWAYVVGTGGLRTFILTGEGDYA